MAVDIKKLDVDTFALSGHKIGAPKGISALYVKEGLRLHPLISGGGQEQGLRAGTENYYYIGGLALAAKLILEDRDKKNTAMAAMKDALLKALAKEDVEFSINGNGDENDVPYILIYPFPGSNPRCFSIIWKGSTFMSLKVPLATPVPRAAAKL